MKAQILVVLGILTVLLVSGCTQPQQQKVQFTRDNMQFLSLEEEVQITMNHNDLGIYSPEEYSVFQCSACKNLTAINPTNGMLTTFDESARDQICAIILGYRVNITFPQGYDPHVIINDNIINCTIYLNGKFYYSTPFSEPIHEGINQGITNIFGSARIDRDTEVEICCEDICESKTFPKIC